MKCSMRTAAAVAALCVLALAAPAARAEHSCPASGTSVDDICAVTLGTSAGAVLKAYAGGGSGYRTLAFDNESMTTAIAVCPGASCTPALNTAGSYTIPAGGTRLFQIPYGSAGGYNDQWNGIAGASSTPVTVEAQ